MGQIRARRRRLHSVLRGVHLRMVSTHILTRTTRNTVGTHSMFLSGFTAKLGTLDSAAMKLPTDGPVVIVTASYEGEPPDNAAHFVKWLTGLDGKELEGVKYSVFGCGNRDWVNTFQRIPKLCDETIEQRGGQRLLARGEGSSLLISIIGFSSVLNALQATQVGHASSKPSRSTKASSGTSSLRYVSLPGRFLRADG